MTRSKRAKPVGILSGAAFAAILAALTMFQLAFQATVARADAETPGKDPAVAAPSPSPLPDAGKTEKPPEPEKTLGAPEKSATISEGKTLGAKVDAASNNQTTIDLNPVAPAGEKPVTEATLAVETKVITDVPVTSVPMATTDAKATVEPMVSTGQAVATSPTTIATQPAVTTSATTIATEHTVITDVKASPSVAPEPAAIKTETAPATPVAVPEGKVEATQVAIVTEREKPSPELAPKLSILPDTGKMTDLARVTLLLQVNMLENGCRNLKRFDDYTATFTKTERVDGVLGEGQVMKLKIRHHPFSVYMKWTVGDKGREVLYSDDQNDGKLLVHAGGWKARILPALKLDPYGSMAMSESRYPITKIGLYNLTEEMLEHRRRDLEDNHHVDCRVVENERFDGRDCYRFDLEYLNPAHSEIYRKSVAYIDRELQVPVSIQNYTWPDEDMDASASLDEATIIENYSYTNIQFNQKLVNLDFDRTNKEYAFRR